MVLEILLWVSITLNVITLISSFTIIRRVKKITKLTSLVYDQLVISKNEEPTYESSAINNKAVSGLFDEALNLSLKNAENDSKTTLLSEDPLMDRESNHLSDDIHTKVMTKAEAHLVKVLQGKFALKDEEDTPPIKS